MSRENDIPRETDNKAAVPLSNDPLIDALLDEIIGGQSPPDLASQILSQLHDSLPATPQTPVNELDSIPTPKSTTIARRRRKTSLVCCPSVNGSVCDSHHLGTRRHCIEFSLSHYK